MSLFSPLCIYKYSHSAEVGSEGRREGEKGEIKFFA
jgi:hypothetical protein